MAFQYDWDIVWSHNFFCVQYFQLFLDIIIKWIELIGDLLLWWGRFQEEVQMIIYQIFMDERGCKCVTFFFSTHVPGSIIFKDDEDILGLPPPISCSVVHYRSELDVIELQFSCNLSVIRSFNFV